MATYGYEALNAAGKTVKGSVESETIDKARAAVKQMGLTPISIKEQGALNKDLNIDIGGYPKPRDLSVFCRQFVAMTKAGVSIVEALKMLTEQTENKQLQKAVAGVKQSVETGETLAKSLAKYPKVFPDLMINMVAAGEASGSLDVALERMAVQFEKTAKTQAMVKKAMIYPIMVVLVAIVVVVIMLVKVIPGYKDMFDQLETGLPALTQAVVNMSDFLVQQWYVALAILVAIIVFFAIFGKSTTGKRIFHKLAIVLPIIKNLNVKQASSMMARTLSTLLAAGVPLVEAVEIVADTMSNLYFKDAMIDCKNAIIVGKPLSKPLEDSKLFPPMVYHMVRIGEESGNTEEMLTKLADYYDEEVEMAVQSLMAALEPMIIIVLAGIVGILVAAVMAPMLKLYNTLGNM